MHVKVRENEIGTNLSSHAIRMSTISFTDPREKLNTHVHVEINSLDSEEYGNDETETDEFGLEGDEKFMVRRVADHGVQLFDAYKPSDKETEPIDYQKLMNLLFAPSSQNEE